jgi:hypothetical protein
MLAHHILTGKSHAKKESGESQAVHCQTCGGKVTVIVMFARDNPWMTQPTMADLFGEEMPAASRHLKNICASGELTPAATVSKMKTVHIEGAAKLYSESNSTIWTRWLRSVTASVPSRRLVGMFIVYAELRDLNRQVMTMADWLKQFEKFLSFTDPQALRHAGKIPHEMALAKAHGEFETTGRNRRWNMFRISIKPWRDTKGGKA